MQQESNFLECKTRLRLLQVQGSRVFPQAALQTGTRPCSFRQPAPRTLAGNTESATQVAQ
jgi:hypothetical protein